MTCLYYIQMNVGSKEEGFKVKEKPTICFGGITSGFVHASKTETYLTGKSLSDSATLKGALKTLKEELQPHSAILEADPEYRRNLAQGLLYKVILGIVNETINDNLKSGACNIQRGVSKGQQSYKSDTDMWPMNQGLAKVEGKSQCTGEAQYIDDMPKYPGELSAAMVQSQLANCDIDSVDTSAALVNKNDKLICDFNLILFLFLGLAWCQTLY